MAYWCGTCLPEAQALAQLKLDYGEEISIVALDVDPSSTPAALAQFKAASGNGTYTWAFDTGQKVTAGYEVAALDTTLILNREGHVVYRDQYATTYQTLKAELARLRP
jgi:thiol-disulfide isomerase/thioredoxin